MSKKEQLKQAIKKQAFVKSNQAYICSKKGTKSSWIMDLRGIMMDGLSIDAITNLFWEKMEQYLPFQVGGEELSAVFLVTAIVQKGHQLGHDVSGFIARKERKHYGLSKRIEGEVKKDIPVVLVDDVTNGASAFKKAFDITELEGGKVEHFFTIIDYNNPNGHKKIKKAGVKKHTLFMLKDFDLELNKLKKNNDIPGVNTFKYLFTLNLPNPDFFHTQPREAFVKYKDKYFFISENGSLFSFEIEKKSIKCIFDSKAFIPPKTPQFVQHNNILVLCPDGTTTYVFDLENQSIIWKYSNYSTITQIKTINNLVILTEERENQQYTLTCLNFTSGKLIEQQEVDTKIELQQMDNKLIALQNNTLFELQVPLLQLTKVSELNAKVANIILNSQHIITQHNDTEIVLHGNKQNTPLYSGPLLHYSKTFEGLLVLWNNTKTLSIKNISQQKILLKKSIPFSHLRTILHIQESNTFILASDYEAFALNLDTKELKYVQKFNDRIMEIFRYNNDTLAIYLQGNQVQFFEFQF